MPESSEANGVTIFVLHLLISYLPVEIILVGLSFLLAIVKPILGFFWVVEGVSEAAQKCGFRDHVGLTVLIEHVESLLKWNVVFLAKIVDDQVASTVHTVGAVDTDDVLGLVHLLDAGLHSGHEVFKELLGGNFLAGSLHVVVLDLWLVLSLELVVFVGVGKIDDESEMKGVFVGVVVDNGLLGKVLGLPLQVGTWGLERDNMFSIGESDWLAEWFGG